MFQSSPCILFSAFREFLICFGFQKFKNRFCFLTIAKFVKYLPQHGGFSYQMLLQQQCLVRPLNIAIKLPPSFLLSFFSFSLPCLNLVSYDKFFVCLFQQEMTQLDSTISSDSPQVGCDSCQFSSQGCGALEVCPWYFPGQSWNSFLYTSVFSGLSMLSQGRCALLECSSGA